MKNFKHPGLFFIFLLSHFFLSAQNQVVVQPGPTDGQFSYLNSAVFNGNPEVNSLLAAAWTYDGMPGTGRSFFRFDLPQLPSGATNLRAYLNLSHNPISNHIGHYGINECKIHRITSNWNESELTWANQPSTDDLSFVILQTSDSGNQHYHNIDVTQMVEAMYNDSIGNLGFRISLVTEELYRSMVFASCNHPDPDLRPSLVLEYDSCTLPRDHFRFQTDGLNCQFFYSDSTTNSWRWDFGDNSGSDIQNPIHLYNRPGRYIVTLTASNSCGQTTATDTVIICQLPVSDFTYSIQDQTVAFKSLTTDAQTWYWSYGNGFFSNLENPVYHYLRAGDYRICLLASNACGSDISCKQLIVDNPVSNPPEGEYTSITAAPNPTKGAVSVDAEERIIYSIDICNSSGLLIKTITGIQREKVDIDLSDVVAGVYLLKITTSEGDFSQIIIKE